LAGREARHRRLLILKMAIARDSSYRDHAPSDIQRLVSEIEEKEGINIPEPVWTVGRLDERASRSEVEEVEVEAHEVEAEEAEVEEAESEENNAEDTPAEDAEDTPAEEQMDAGVDRE
jgi:hypothetical protein